MFFRGKLVGVYLLTSTMTKANDSVPVMAQFMIVKPYGEFVVAKVPGDQSALVPMRLKAIPEVSLATVQSNGTESFPQLLQSLSIRPGEAYLIRVEIVGNTAAQNYASLTPYSEEAEEKFLKENAREIAYTVTYMKESRRRSRAGLIDALKHQVANERELLKTHKYAAEERVAMERNIADNERKLKDLLATPEDVYPPPSWKEAD
jgi:hypothetical protein